MKLVVPQRARSRVEETARGLRIIVPAARFIPLMLFLPVWLVLWVYGLRGAVGLIKTVPGPPLGLILFMTVWLTMWLAGGAWAARTLVWMLGGREEIDIDDLTITLRHRVFGVTRTRSYDRRHIEHLRTIAAEEGVPTFFGAARVWQGALAFDYGARTIRMAEGLEEREARQLLVRIQERHRLSSGSGAR